MPVLMVAVVNAAGYHHLPVIVRLFGVFFAPSGKLRTVVVTGGAPVWAVFAWVKDFHFSEPPASASILDKAAGQLPQNPTAQLEQI